MRPVKIALCSPGLDRATAGSVTCGLDFLASLVQKQQPAEFFTVAPKDVMKLSPRECDFLLVSFTAVPCITDYARAVKFKKPAVTTLFGGPGVYCPGALVEMADAVMVGRGETAIFKALNGDYSGMATRNNAFKKDSVEIFATDLLSPLATSVGCQCRCAFCQYSWGNVFASANAAPADSLTYTSGSSRSAKAPAQESLLKDLKFKDLGVYSMKRPVVGLDIFTPSDQRITLKPTSIALLKSVLKRIGRDARAEGTTGPRFLRMYCVAGYPWDPKPNFSYVREALREANFPDGFKLNISLGLCHFIPKITTPLECASVSLYSLREDPDVVGYRRPYEPRSGPFIVISPMSVPGPRRAVEETILSRTRDPGDVELVCREKDIYRLAEKRSGLIGWLDEMPAPWLKRVNDPRARVKRLYETLRQEFPALSVPVPRYPDDLCDAGERYGVPVYRL